MCVHENMRKRKNLSLSCETVKEFGTVYQPVFMRIFDLPHKEISIEMPEIKETAEILQKKKMYFCCKLKEKV